MMLHLPFSWEQFMVGRIVLITIIYIFVVQGMLSISTLGLFVISLTAHSSISIMSHKEEKLLYTQA